MPDFHFSPGAHWLWSSQSTPARNAFACFRRAFEIAGKIENKIENPILHITADARYELFINGNWIGSGPPRAWPEHWTVDEYDLSGLLKSGKNCIAVLVHDFGISTFQYLKCAPGLVAEFQWREEGQIHSFSSDEFWRAIPHPSFAWSTPRINVQTGWEEQFDARLEPRDDAKRDWREIDFDDSTWPQAEKIRAAGNAPHENFELRDIPFLAREIVEPKRIVQTEIVTTAPLISSINLRDVLNSRDETANYLHGRMLAVSHLVSENDQQIELHFPIGAQGFEWKLNGELLPANGEKLQLTDHPVLRLQLKKGINTLMARPPQAAHSWRCSLNIWHQSPLEMRAFPEDENGGKWLALGPFADTPAPENLPGFLQREYVSSAQIHEAASGEKWEEIWARGVLQSEDFRASLTRALSPCEEFETDAFAVCASERTLPKAAPQIENLHALMRDSSDWTTIHPPENSALEYSSDVRVLLDFGDELIGYFEFEIDAPDGAIFDWQGFEFIQRDGKMNLCDLMNNSFRYVCREGTQRYRTWTRRGFRFCFLSLRNFSRPIKIRFARAIFNSYPTSQDGNFACSDALLERIWHVGAQSVRACAEDAYTDCPAYEQVFWTGDARNEAIVDLVCNGDARLSSHSWFLAARSLERTPLVEATAPSGRPLILPAWTFLWMRWAHEHFLLTGELEFGLAALPYLERNIAGIEAHLNERDLFEIVAWNMFDWAAMDTPADAIVIHQNCLAVLGLRQNAQLARMLERDDLASRWDALADRIARAVNAHGWNENQNAYADCIRRSGVLPAGELSPIVSQQTQTAAYISGVAGAPFGSDEREERCRQNIDDAPENFVSAGSPFFMFFALEAFARQGRFEKLMDEIRNYWGPQIEAGATTFWEMFHAHKPRLTRSHCHGWSAAPTFFLSQHVLGISPLEPGYQTVRVAPQLAGVWWAQGRVPTPRGAIEIFWKKEDDKFSLRLELPPRTCARLELPSSGVLQVEKGQVCDVALGPGVLRAETTSRSLKLEIALTPRPPLPRGGRGGDENAASITFRTVSESDS